MNKKSEIVFKKLADTLKGKGFKAPFKIKTALFDDPGMDSPEIQQITAKIKPLIKEYVWDEAKSTHLAAEFARKLFFEARHAAHGSNSSKIKVASGCSSCAVSYINGVKCHEHGCPEAWKDQTRECKWCGEKFHPTEREQRCCCESCEEAYSG